jgi:Uncharacterised nucleotidyltransferase
MPRRAPAPATIAFYQRTLALLQQAGVPLLVGGAYAFAHYTGVERHTRDLDVIVLPDDTDGALTALRDAGYETERPFPHWLAKARRGKPSVDVIFGSGNGVTRVDREWFEHATPAQVLGLSVDLVPVEELLWTKAFIQERERFDGADVAHLLLTRGDTLDWRRLLRRFGPHWRVLLSHLVLFGFIYPAEHGRVPRWVLRTLLERLDETPAVSGKVCHGTLLSRQQYLVDIDEWGYQDARTRPDNTMTDEDIARWTAGIAVDGCP